MKAILTNRSILLKSTDLKPGMFVVVEDGSYRGRILFTFRNFDDNCLSAVCLNTSIEVPEIWTDIALTGMLFSKVANETTLVILDD